MFKVTFIALISFYAINAIAESSEYCLFIDSNAATTYVMADDCAQTIADNNCDSGEALATCDGGNPNTGCTLSSINLDLEQQHLHQRDLGQCQTKPDIKARRIK